MLKAAQDLPLKSSYPFPRKNRLNQGKDFESIFTEGKKLSFGFFTLFYRPNSLNFARLGIIVKKTNINQAVKRNQLRRLVRESFRQQSQLAGLDIVICTRSLVGKMDRDNLRAQLAHLWQRLTK